MDLRLVEYLVYLALGVLLTLWVGRTLYRSGAPFLLETLHDQTLADSVNRLLVVGFYLVGLGGVALLLQVDSTLGSIADLVRAVATKLGLGLLLLGGLHLVNLVVLRRMARPGPAPSQPAAAEARFQPRAGRFPY
jgi:hypothetical protein